LGFRTDHIITMDANFSRSICDRGNPKDLAGCKAAIFDVLDRMKGISGVQSAVVASTVPLNRWFLIGDLKIEGGQEITLNTGALISSCSVSPIYFRTFGIPLLSGREFTDADTTGSQPVAIVDEAFATRYLDGRALGRRISTESDKKGNRQWTEIVGVVQSARDSDLSAQPAGEIYFPYAQEDSFQSANFIARTSADPAVMLPALRRAVWSEDKNAPITEVETMDQMVASDIAEPRFQAILLGSFGALGLLLSIVGIYGVISYGVTQRTREIGVRMALGAQPANVLRMVIREGMLLAAAGIIGGIAGALALGRVLQSLLFEVKPTDPATLISVAVVLALVALAACYIPARRAMRVDPMVALRYE
ncbi:MAG: FtsX-like permease family protein, partial [Candidatus Acidiferrales bacterium]